MAGRRLRKELRKMRQEMEISNDQRQELLDISAQAEYDRHQARSKPIQQIILMDIFTVMGVQPRERPEPSDTQIVVKPTEQVRITPQKRPEITLSDDERTMIEEKRERQRKDQGVLAS